MLSEKINKNERKNKAEIFTEIMGQESAEFWIALGESQGGEEEFKPTIKVITSFLLKLVLAGTFFYFTGTC